MTPPGSMSFARDTVASSKTGVITSSNWLVAHGAGPSRSSTPHATSSTTTLSSSQTSSAMHERSAREQTRPVRRSLQLATRAGGTSDIHRAQRLRLALTAEVGVEPYGEARRDRRL